MKVFVSWSGDSSREAAVALHSWLPKVLQDLQPFVSSKDIDKGELWASRLQGELVDTSFGIVCLTRHNLRSPWLHYEAGALSSSVDARVCPVLFGCEKKDVEAPFKQLQLTDFNVEEVTRLVISMNGALPSPIPDALVSETVQVWWPTLSALIDKIDFEKDLGKVDQGSEPAKPNSSDSEKLDEVIGRLRDLERRIRPMPRGRISQSARELPVDYARLRLALITAGFSIKSSKLNKDELTIYVQEPFVMGEVDPELRKALAESSRAPGSGSINIESPGASLYAKDGEVVEVPF